MKICYLVEYLNPGVGGGGRYASDLIDGVKKNGIETVIIKETDDGFGGHLGIRRGLGMLASVAMVRRSASDCDVIHALDVYPNGIIAWLANIWLRKKLVITAIGTYSVAPLHHPKTAWLSRKALKSADALIAISRYTREEILKVVKNVSMEVINPGIDFASFYQGHLKSEEKLILSVGALKERKGYHISIPAFARANVPGSKYIIVGKQDNRAYLSELKHIAESHSVLDKVIFLENISDVELKNLYKKASLFVLTSINSGYHFEGFGLVFLEAASSGLPVIGTRGNGIEDAINKNGILVEQNNIDATAGAIRDIFDNNKRWQEMSDFGYEWARSHNLSGIVEKYINTYKKIL